MLVKNLIICLLCICASPAFAVYDLPFPNEADEKRKQDVDIIYQQNAKEYDHIIPEQSPKTGSEVTDFHDQPDEYYNAPNAY